MSKFSSTKVIELGSAAFRQPKAESHCKFVHGYRLKAKIWFAANELDSNNWVFDFGGLKELKTKLQNTFDHKLVIDKNDPAKPAFKELQRYGASDIVEMDGVGIEKFAEFVFNEADVFVKYKSQNRVWCEKVEVFEHEDNSAIFRKEEEKTAVESKVEEPKQTLPSIVPTPVTPELKAQPRGPQPANVGGNPITKGWSNPFGGTSWGA